jgi:hypothetical protein
VDAEAEERVVIDDQDFRLLATSPTIGPSAAPIRSTMFHRHISNRKQLPSVFLA